MSDGESCRECEVVFQDDAVMVLFKSDMFTFGARLSDLPDKSEVASWRAD